MILKPKFVHFMPKEIQSGILYISPEFRAVIHRCACGCGEKIHTPLSPTNWKMTYDGKSVTLNPSVGNWSYECRSHYWIRNNKVVWAENWSDYEVNLNRKLQQERTSEYYTPKKALSQIKERSTDKYDSNDSSKAKSRLWNKIKLWFNL